MLQGALRLSKYGNESFYGFSYQIKKLLTAALKIVFCRSGIAATL
ncbi:hypothetical protein LEP1GSC137_2477 [Leptospira borgpetersenii str. Noumea 25]|uniref:Uncharacterized protein n=1 Tax=Leptospira borgpetersenii serovar Ballum TaxID=280505 RepID=A0A0S2IUL1_LEPBO|nr:hypothetical protein LBBP_03135 [Leptospira borgpetersenii serovar Ballum]EKQ99771.1 hypothetical protein LEP1GSC121_2161 [Leptospira borgpetersenii serovar Castellonis str. 200801910]EMO08985.1 hypothetical protein LEP1GSC137_2477 [Leptospira borgpetersenii str. Noumea 25]